MSDTADHLASISFHQWATQESMEEYKEELRRKVMELGERGEQIVWTKKLGEPPQGKRVQLISREDVLKLLE